MTNSDLDFSKWGGLVSETSNLDTIQTSDGVHIKHWKGSRIVYRIINSDMIESSTHILIGFNAAISQRDQKKPPFFSGGGKASSVRAPILSIADPSTFFDSVTLGWYLGTAQDPKFQQNLANFIDSFCSIIKLKPILFGGSGGGFASLVLSKLMQSQSIVLAMNPQTDIFKWNQNDLKKLCSIVWNKQSLVELKEFFELHEISYAYEFSKEGNSDILVLQNIIDTYHMQLHFPRIHDEDLKTISVTGNDERLYWFLGCWGQGHYSPWPEHVKEILSLMIANNSVVAAINFLKTEFFPDILESGLVNSEDISLEGGGRLNTHKQHLLYKGRSDLNFESIEINGFDFSKFDKTDRNLAFSINALRQVDFLLKKDAPDFGPYFVLYHLLSWWDHVNNDKVTTSALAWYDMACGLRAQKIARLICLAKIVPGVGRKMEPLLEIAEEHLLWFSKKDYIKKGNHGIFQIHGLLALGRALGRPDIESKSIELMNDMYRHQFGIDMVHVENSPEYHRLVVNKFDEYFSTGWYGDQASTLLEESKILTYWLIDYEKRFLTIGDSEAKLFDPDPTHDEQAFQDADFHFEHSGRIYGCKIFEDSGYLSLKSQHTHDNLLFSLSSFRNIGHRHADDLSFVLFDSGEWRFIDPGKYSYQQDKRELIRQTKQHNCLEINNRSYSMNADAYYETARVSSSYDDEAGVFVTMLEKKFNDSGTHKRWLVYSPEEFFILIDDLMDLQANNYSQWLQIGSAYTEAIIHQNRIDLKSATAPDFRLFFISSEKGNTINCYRGDSINKVGWSSKSYDVINQNYTIQQMVRTSSCTMVSAALFSDRLTLENVQERLSILGISSLFGSNA